MFGLELLAFAGALDRQELGDFGRHVRGDARDIGLEHAGREQAAAGRSGAEHVEGALGGGLLVEEAEPPPEAIAAVDTWLRDVRRTS